MIALLKVMFIDLYNRTQAMVDHLAALTLDTPGASDFKKDTLYELIGLRQKLGAVLDEGILEDAFFTKNVSIIYSHLDEEYREIEQYLFQPISRYELRAEGFFEVVINAIYKEINFAQKPPYVSTMSNSDSYFRAYPKYKIIILPQGEEKHLLNLGDLYHEIGHLIYMQYNTKYPFLTGGHLQGMTDHYRDLLRGTRTTDGHLRAAIHRARQAWRDTWMEELTCDLIAAYLVGPAYGWSHLKICVLSSKQNGLYSQANLFRDHPPDDIRMQVILQMLILIGCKTEADSIVATWQDLTAAARNRKPAHYEQLFPSSFVNSMAKNVFEGCCDINLQSYPQQLKNHTRPISLIINDAWSKILTDPDDATQWVKDQIANILSWVS